MPSSTPIASSPRWHDETMFPVLPRQDRKHQTALNTKLLTLPHRAIAGNRPAPQKAPCRPNQAPRRVLMHQHNPATSTPAPSTNTLAIAGIRQNKPRIPRRKRQCDACRPRGPALNLNDIQRIDHRMTDVFRRNETGRLASVNRRARNKTGRRQHDAFGIGLCIGQ